MGLLSEKCKSQSGFCIHRVASRCGFGGFATGCRNPRYRLHDHRDVKLIAYLFLRRLFSAGQSPITVAQENDLALGRDPVRSAVISMGKSLKHSMIAAGVETPEQLTFLQARSFSRIDDNVQVRALQLRG